MTRSRNALNQILKPFVNPLKSLFRQMFGGGSADLILTEPDLLTAGVEISVQPPGKRSNLKPHEWWRKALFALALLFSIIRAKTIPFVILMR